MAKDYKLYEDVGSHDAARPKKTREDEDDDEKSGQRERLLLKAPFYLFHYKNNL